LWKWYKFRRSATRSVTIIDIKNGAALLLMLRNGAKHFLNHAFYNAKGVPAGMLTRFSRYNPAQIAHVYFAPSQRCRSPIGQTRPAVTARQKHSFYDKKLACNSMREGRGKAQKSADMREGIVSIEKLFNSSIGCEAARKHYRGGWVYCQEQNRICCEKIIRSYLISNGT
jgi:hypothetical protein